ncbi:integrase core domain-containing protein, partial [Miniimonas arenae]|uniref:integrase core domain-containing protein n=1 Tax=Miniimonas arenae TaxID=676201 RepID=UPI0028A6A33F
NAMAEALNSLFKAECIRNPRMRPVGGWKNVGDVEIAVAEYIDWFNHRRLHGEIGLVPPAELEALHWVTRPSHDSTNTPTPTGAGTR